MRPAPEPHPLDFDWRFTRDTVSALCCRVNGPSLLAVGTPLLVEGSFHPECTVHVVDHQPHLSSPNVDIVDVEVAATLSGRWATAILDPPWYPLPYRRWLAWAAQHVPVDGTILSSLWPIDTRPTAELERDDILSWTAGWADYHIEPATLYYEVPLFESIARGLQGIPDPSIPWRRGDLLKLTLRRTPPLPPAITKTEVWRRFVWSDYQLALRVTSNTGEEPKLLKHPFAKGWLWPSYSRRAEGLDRIDLWSSRNEVAMVEGATQLSEELSQFTTGGLLTGIYSDALHQLLSSWQVPKRPFYRSYSWTQHV